MTLYAAFASNLDPNLMAERCPYSPLRGTGWITGWRLTFGGEELGWEGAMATVVEDPADPTNQVFVALYDIHPTRLAARSRSGCRPWTASSWPGCTC